MIIEGGIVNWSNNVPVTSHWSYNPDVPLVIHVAFEGHSKWNFSLDLFQEAFTSPVEQPHGFGDVVVDLVEEDTYIHLSNGQVSASVVFPTEKIREFLDQIDEVDPEGIISRELDRFLETL